MWNRLFSAGSLPALEAMLKFASARQKVIAANIANVDTVGYRARDLAAPDFRKALAEAFQPREGGAADAGIVKPNGNNVDLEIEMARMVRNSALHGAAATLLANQFTLLREAVSGHVSS
jgi:flagellar basal-body rod protein FlgB